MPTPKPHRLTGALADRRGRIAALLAVPALGASLAGCGLSHSATTDATVENTGALVTSHATAHQMFGAMTHALRKVHSVGIDFTVKANKGKATRITMEIQVPGRVEATVQHGSEVVNERWIGNAIYFRYNYAALDDLTGYPYLANALHDRWVQLPAAAVPLARAMEHMATDKMLQECDILGPTGRLSVGSPTQVNGLAAVSLRDHGGKPGTARRTITLSANPPYLPLRIVQTHAGQPGGSAFDDCYSNRTTRTMMRRAEVVSRRFDRSHHIRFKRAVETVGSYNEPLHLVKPPDPLEPQGTVAQTSNSVSV